MSDIPQEPARRIPGGDPRDRRREPRVEFARNCRVNITAPPWAMTREPLIGTTGDITLHGVRITFEQAEPAHVSAWAEAVRNDDELRVEIVLEDIGEGTLLKGQIVWLQETDPDPARATGPSSIGVLFSVMKERDQQRLIALIDKQA